MSQNSANAEAGGAAEDSGGSGVGGGARPVHPNGEPVRTPIHRGAKFDYEDLTLPGSGLHRQVVRHPGAVVLLPLIQDAEGERIVLIRNYRWSVERYLYELPAGTRERNEDPARTAARELEEETGYSAAELTHLFSFYTGPGMTDERMHAYVATGLRAVGQDLEDDELMTVHPTAVARVLEMVRTGEIEDGKSIAVILRWWLTRGS